MGQCEYPSRQLSRQLETMKAHVAVSCSSPLCLDGPIRATCLNIMVYERAHASTCMELLSGCYGPTRANSPNITVHATRSFMVGPPINNVRFDSVGLLKDHIKFYSGWPMWAFMKA